MATFPFSCPQCGAPLPTPPTNATSVVCQHCQTTIRATVAPSAAAPSAAALGPRPLSAEDMAFLRQLVQNNKRTEAIELYCRITGSSLSAAYAAIDDLQNTAVAPVVPWDEIRALVQSQRKIEAIKRLRETTQLGLKEAKDIADALERGEPPPADLQLRAEMPPAPADNPLAQVYTLMQAGQKIQAIKAYREVTGVGLAEAKDAVESVMDRGATQLPAFAKPQLRPASTPALGASRLDEVLQQVRAGRKIEAIKLYREMTGVGLKEAKDAVEALERGQPIPQGAFVPAPSTAPKRGGKGCWSVVLWIMFMCLAVSGGCGFYVQQTDVYQCATTYLSVNDKLEEQLGRPVKLVGPALVQNFSESSDLSGSSRLQFAVITGVTGPEANGLLQIVGSRTRNGSIYLYSTLYRPWQAMDIPIGPFVECP